MGRAPWPAIIPLPFWLGSLASPLTDAPHREAAQQDKKFDVEHVVPELATGPLNDPRALGGGSRRPSDIAANGAHKQVWLGVVLFVWKFDEEHFRYDATLTVMRAPAMAPKSPPPRAPAGPDRTLLDEFVKNRINSRGARGLPAPPIAGLWNPDSGTDPFFLPREQGYVDSIMSV
jgi:hypothetical protein